MATSGFYTDVVPMGDQTYVINPNGTSGNYYLTNHGKGARTEEIGNLFLPRLARRGQARFKLGVDFDRIEDHQEYSRQPYMVENTSGIVTRRVAFTSAPPFTGYNTESAGYAWGSNSILQQWLRRAGRAFRRRSDCPRQ